MRKMKVGKYRAPNAATVIGAAFLILAIAGTFAWCVSGPLVTPDALAAKASANLKLERLKFVLTVLGTLGAAIVFVVGLAQYGTAQQWKRVEFVVSEFKCGIGSMRLQNRLKIPSTPSGMSASSRISTCINTMV